MQGFVTDRLGSLGISKKYLFLREQGADLGAEEFVVRANRDESDSVCALVIENRPIITRYVDTAAAGMRFVESVIVE